MIAINVAVGTVKKFDAFTAIIAFERWIASTTSCGIACTVIVTCGGYVARSITEWAVNIWFALVAIRTSEAIYVTFAQACRVITVSVS